MDENPVRIVPVEGSALGSQQDHADRPADRRGPPIWVILVMIVSAVGLVWMLSFGRESDVEDFRTVYTVEGYAENSFETIRPFLQQPVAAFGYQWSLVALLRSTLPLHEADTPRRWTLDQYFLHSNSLAFPFRSWLTHPQAGRQVFTEYMDTCLCVLCVSRRSTNLQI